jgi:hypothetical protein
MSRTTCSELLLVGESASLALLVPFVNLGSPKRVGAQGLRQTSEPPRMHRVDTAKPRPGVGSTTSTRSNPGSTTDGGGECRNGFAGGVGEEGRAHTHAIGQSDMYAFMNCLHGA